MIEERGWLVAVMCCGRLAPLADFSVPHLVRTQRSAQWNVAILKPATAHLTNPYNGRRKMCDTDCMNPLAPGCEPTRAI